MLHVDSVGAASATDPSAWDAECGKSSITDQLVDSRTLTVAAGGRHGSPQTSQFSCETALPVISVG